MQPSESRRISAFEGVTEYLYSQNLEDFKEAPKKFAFVFNHQGSKRT
jgi:hypothetical protein